VTSVPLDGGTLDLGASRNNWLVLLP
jgi:hypothetical protein